MAELVDATDLKSVDRKVMGVRFSLPAQSSSLAWKGVLVRHCSNPTCKTSIFECMGTCKAGDIDEAMQGLRAWNQVRELCPKCATRAVLFWDTDEKRLANFPSVGWGDQS